MPLGIEEPNIKGLKEVSYNVRTASAEVYLYWRQDMKAPSSIVLFLMNGR